MKRAVLQQPLDMRIEDVDVPLLHPGDCLLRVEAALVCGTDVRIYEGRKKKNVDFPTVLGHEFAGTIVEKSGGLPRGLTVGDRVAVYPLVQCGQCVACDRGRSNICRSRVAFGYQLAGGFSEYVRVPAAAAEAGNLVPVGNASAEEAALIEPMACAYHGLSQIGAADAQTLLVVGCGPLGLMHIRLARSLGVPAIAAIDPSRERRAVAAASGAQLTLSPEEATAQAVRDWTGDLGIEAMIVAVGRADAFEPYLSALSPGAGVNLFAGFPTGEDELRVPANEVHYNEYAIVGSSSSRLSDFDDVARLLSTESLSVGDLVTARMPIDDTAAAIERTKAGRDLRIAVTTTV